METRRGTHARRHDRTVTIKPDRDLALAARTDACLLLIGGPDRAQEVAYRLHLASGWRHGAFTVIDCASPLPTVEPRVFDALFPPALPARAGIVQLRLVQAGTVLLKEINALPLPTQQRLARRLSEFGTQAEGRSRRRLMASSSEPLFDRVLAGRSTTRSTIV